MYPTLLYTAKGRRCSDINLELSDTWLDHNYEVASKYGDHITEWTSNYWVNKDLLNGYFRSERVNFMTDEIYPDNKELAISLTNALIESRPLENDIWLFRGIRIYQGYEGAPQKFDVFSRGFTSYSFSYQHSTSDVI